MNQVAQAWELCVDRGPDWLFVRPRGLSADLLEAPAIAEQIWGLLEQNFLRRLVLEMDEIPYLNSHMIGQLVWLHKRIVTHDGLMRICGLSEANQEVLRMVRLETRFPQFRDREQAVMGHRPQQPR